MSFSRLVACIRTSLNGEPEQQIVSRTAPARDDLSDAIVACLKQDDVVGGYVDGHVGPVGTFENIPRYIEIGLTEDGPTLEAPVRRYLATVHLWSKSYSSDEVQSVLGASERAIAASNSKLVFKHEYSEVRYDERFASFHGLLRVRLSCSVKPRGERK